MLKLRTCLLPVVAALMTTACSDLNPRPVNPPSEATLALRKLYNEKMLGHWTIEKTDTASNMKLYEHYVFEPKGKLTAYIRYGRNDSIEYSWQDCSSSASETTCGPLQKHKFRYFINDTITGRWELLAGEGDNNAQHFICMYADTHTAESQWASYNHYSNVTEGFQNLIRRFYFCNGTQLFIGDLHNRETMFTRDEVQPSF